MEIDLEKKSKELKEIVSQYETPNFLGNIGLMMQLIASPDKLGSLEGLSSPQRQLYYVAALNLTSSNEKIKKVQFSNNEWDAIKRLLNEIEIGYQQFFYPKNQEDVNDEWKNKRRIAMPTFLGYFNQGHLNYEEQVIERVIEYFTPFDSDIKNSLGLSVSEFVEIYNYIDELPNKFLDENVNHKDGQVSWQEFTERMTANGINPDKWIEHMPAHLNNYIEFVKDKGKMYRFTNKQLEEKFGSNRTNAFLSALTAKRTETSFLYYTETNPLYLSPIFQVSQDEYQIMETKQLIHAIYNLLQQLCVNAENLKEKFYAVRGDKLEEKIVKVFQVFFKNKAIVYKGFYTQKGHEQDVLILINGTAFIIEAKSSKRKEPRRDPDKAYELILSNFAETIQKGYDQAYRVKDYFLDREVMKIYSDQGLTNHIVDINTKKFHNVFSLVVTLENFGLIQADLNELLEIYDNDEFPWSLCLDNLEIFLLTLTKQKKTLADLVHFLNIRQNMHGHVYCSDELEICGGFLKGIITKKISESSQIIAIYPDVADIFDRYYHKGGLGFENEKNMKLKTDEKYFRVGVDSVKNNKAEKR